MRSRCDAWLAFGAGPAPARGVGTPTHLARRRRGVPRPRAGNGPARSVIPAGGRRGRGFILADALVGLAVIVVLLSTTAAVGRWTRRATGGMADVRAATAAAEAALAEGRAEPVGDAVAGSVAGRRWGRASATVGGRTVTLVGLVPNGGGR